MPNATKLALTTAVAASSFVYARNVIRRTRANKAIKAANAEWANYVHLYNEETGTNVTVHRDFLNVTAILDCLK